MTHSHIFPYLVLNAVDLLFYTSLLLYTSEVAHKLSDFCKMARR